MITIMRLAILLPGWLERSVEIYLKNVLRGLQRMDYEVSRFGPEGPVPATADVVWDPGATGARAPYPIFRTLDRGAVVTIHGAAALSLPARDYYPNLSRAFYGQILHRLRQLAWRRFAGGRFQVITVSSYAKREIERYLSLDPKKITPIYHGVDHETFFPGDPTPHSKPYFLYVGVYQPRKNLDRLLEAYRSANLQGSVGLTLVCPGPRSRRRDDPGVEWLPGPLSKKQLSAYYQRALAFVFPSLQEGFGMPILEAMASGCPVITSRGSACEEVAADAAVLVDPRSVDEIRSAMLALATDLDLRHDTRRRGLIRAREFSWESSARAHAAVFEHAVNSA